MKVRVCCSPNVRFSVPTWRLKKREPQDPTTRQFCPTERKLRWKNFQRLSRIFFLFLLKQSDVQRHGAIVAFKIARNFRHVGRGGSEIKTLFKNVLSEERFRVPFFPPFLSLSLSLHLSIYLSICPSLSFCPVTLEITPLSGATDVGEKRQRGKPPGPSRCYHFLSALVIGPLGRLAWNRKTTGHGRPWER